MIRTHNDDCNECARALTSEDEPHEVTEDDRVCVAILPSDGRVYCNVLYKKSTKALLVRRFIKILIYN